MDLVRWVLGQYAIELLDGVGLEATSDEGPEERSHSGEEEVESRGGEEDVRDDCGSGER